MLADTGICKIYLGKVGESHGECNRAEVFYDSPQRLVHSFTLR